MTAILSLKTSTVAKLTGLSIRQLDSWQRNGFFVPSISAAHGSGSRMLYSFDDVVQLRLIAKLKSQGISLQKRRKALHHLRVLVTGHEDVSPIIFADKGKLWIICKNQSTSSMVIDAYSGQWVMKIIFDQFKDETLRETINLVNVSETFNKVASVRSLKLFG